MCAMNGQSSDMGLAQIGPATTAFVAMATVVGAGIVLGSFARGLFGLVASWPRREIEARVLEDGYVGGAIGVIVALVDLLLHYAL